MCFFLQPPEYQKHEYTLLSEDVIIKVRTSQRSYEEISEADQLIIQSEDKALSNSKFHD